MALMGTTLTLGLPLIYTSLDPLGRWWVHMGEPAYELNYQREHQSRGQGNRILLNALYI